MVNTPYCPRALKGVTELALVDGYSHFGGKHGESAAVANVLRFMGVRAPHTKKPYTEEMLFGLGGGLGFGYWVFDYSHMPQPVLSVGFRRFGWEGFDLGFVDDMCARAGANVRVRQTSSKAMAERSLRSTLTEERPAIVTADWGKLPSSPMPDEMEYVPHVLTVCGTDGDDFLVDDLDPKPKRVAASELAVARAAVRSTHHRMRLLERADDSRDLAEGIRDAMADCVASLLEPSRPNSGLPALGKWASMMSSRSESKSWRRVFDTPERLAGALAWSVRWIETGTGGGAFRAMYADFLDEAAGVLGEEPMRELAAEYRRLAKAWSAFAREADALASKPEEATASLDALADLLEELHGQELAAAERLREAADVVVGVEA